MPAAGLPRPKPGGGRHCCSPAPESESFSSPFVSPWPLQSANARRVDLAFEFMHAKVVLPKFAPLKAGRSQMHHLHSTHDPLLVGLAVLLAVLGSWTALDLLRRVWANAGTARRWWLA